MLHLGWLPVADTTDESGNARFVRMLIEAETSLFFLLTRQSVPKEQVGGDMEATEGAQRAY